jgi:hypothetical protein
VQSEREDDFGRLLVVVATATRGQEGGRDQDGQLAESLHDQVEHEALMNERGAHTAGGMAVLQKIGKEQAIVPLA